MPASVDVVQAGDAAKMPALMRLLPLLILSVVLGAAEPARPVSRLDAEATAMVQRLAPGLAGKRVLVAPFMGNRHHLDPWSFATIAEERVIVALRAAGITLADASPVHRQFPVERPGLPPAVPYSTRGLMELSQQCNADVVLLGGVQILNETSITLYVYDGADGHRLAKAEADLAIEDIALPALMPAANHAWLQWSESKLGSRFDDGTASGFAALGIARGTLQPPRTIPLPGDVVLWWEPWRRIRRPRCGIVRALTGVGQAEVIVQRRTGPDAPVVEVQSVDFGGFPRAVYRPTAGPE